MSSLPLALGLLAVGISAAGSIETVVPGTPDEARAQGDATSLGHSRRG